MVRVGPDWWAQSRYPMDNSGGGAWGCKDKLDDLQVFQQDVCKRWRITYHGEAERGQVQRNADDGAEEARQEEALAGDVH